LRKKATVTRKQACKHHVEKYSQRKQRGRRKERDKEEGKNRSDDVAHTDGCEDERGRVRIRKSGGERSRYAAAAKATAAAVAAATLEQARTGIDPQHAACPTMRRAATRRREDSSGRAREGRSAILRRNGRRMGGGKQEMR